MIMGIGMEEILRAIETKDCDRLVGLLYYKADELEEEQLGEILKRAEKLAVECKHFELYKLVVYFYLEFLEEDRIGEFEALVKKEDTFEAKFHLADLYALIGELEKALDLYTQILEEETEKGNRENIAKIYYNMGLIHEEFTEYDKAIDLMEKAAEIFEELEREEDYLHTLVYIAYLKFEKGEISEAKAEIAELLPKLTDKPTIRSQAHLVVEEIFEDKDNYEAALQECLYAMIEGKRGEYLDVVFEALVDVIWQLMIEDEFETIYNNMDMFIRVSEDTEMKQFFEGIKAVALFKDGKIEEDEVKHAISSVKNRRLFNLLELLAEAEF